MNCPTCNKEIKPGFQFCPACGSSVSHLSGESGVELDGSIGGMRTMVGGEVQGLPAVAGSRFGTPQSALRTRYEILEEIGRGGFARVWRARDLKLGRMVAVKRLVEPAVKDHNWEMTLERFRREALAIAGLNHRNIVGVYDVGVDAEGDYIVMELVEGGTLRDLLKEKGKLEASEALGILRGAAQGLGFAHKKNLIHRDVKPANILLHRDGAEWVPKIVDFGLARVGRESELSLTGYGMGTPWYMPPEQRRDAKGVNHTADVYALGKTLYEMLTGEVPDQVDFEKLDPAMARVVLKCVKNNPEERYFSMDELMADLEVGAGSSARRGPVSGGEAVQRNLCAACGTDNPVDVKFCESCGAGLTRVCGECGRENSVHKPFCGGCGTDVEAYGKLRDIRERIEKYAGDRKWSRVVKEHGLLPDRARLRGDKARALLQEMDKRKAEADDQLGKRDAQNAKARKLVEEGRHEEAAEVCKKSLEIDPDQKYVLQLLKEGIPAAIRERERLKKEKELHRLEGEIQRMLKIESLEKARELAAQSLKLDPDQPGMKKRMEEINGLIQERDRRKHLEKVEATNRTAEKEAGFLAYERMHELRRLSLELEPKQPELNDRLAKAALASLKATCGEMTEGSQVLAIRTFLDHFPETSVSDEAFQMMEKAAERFVAATVERLHALKSQGKWMAYADLLEEAANVVDTQKTPAFTEAWRELKDVREKITILENQAANFRANNQLTKAIESYREISKQCSDHPSAEMLCGNLYRLRKRHKTTVLLVLLVVFVLLGLFVIIPFLRGFRVNSILRNTRTSLEKGQWEEVFTATDQILRSDPQNVWAKNLRQEALEVEKAARMAIILQEARNARDASDWRGMQSAADRALALDARDQEAQRLKQEATDGQVRHLISNHIEQARAAREREQWNIMLAAVDRALGMDANHQEAQALRRDALAGISRDRLNRELELARRSHEASDWRGMQVAAERALMIDPVSEEAKEFLKEAETNRLKILENILVDARNAQHASDWLKLQSTADRALGVDAANREALSLKREAEANLVPVLEVRAMLNGRSVPATLTAGGRTHTLPDRIILEGAQTFQGTVNYETGGRHYTAAHLSLRVDWRGVETREVVLREIQVPRPGQVWEVPELGMKLNWVGPGSFQMGTASGGRDNERPVREVRITRGFWMGVYEVTQREYEALMGNNPSHFKGDENRPVENVTWNEAVAFCQRLTERERAAGCLPAGYVYRLPTEAEWEYAARGGTRGRETTYAGSNNVDEVAWNRGNSGGQTRPVGQKRANELGLHDMSGNVWEWVHDWYQYSYQGLGMVDPRGHADGVHRVYRGGGWQYDASYCRVTYRTGWYPSNRYINLGFRVVLAPQLQ